MSDWGVLINVDASALEKGLAVDLFIGSMCIATFLQQHKDALNMDTAVTINIYVFDEGQVFLLHNTIDTHLSNCQEISQKNADTWLPAYVHTV